MQKGVVLRSLAAAALCQLLFACWPSGGAVILATQDGGSNAGPDRSLQGSIVVSGASGASLDLEDEVEPNDDRGHAHRLQVTDGVVRIRRGVVSAGRQLVALRGSGEAAERITRRFPATDDEPQPIPAAHASFTPDWLSVGRAGVLLLQDGSSWTAELQSQHRAVTEARWQQPSQGVVHGMALVEDLLFVLVARQGQRLLLALDPWTGRPLVSKLLGQVPWTGLAAARDPATGLLRILTVDASGSWLLSARLTDVQGDLTLGPFRRRISLPPGLRPESLAHDGDLAWLLDERGRAHGWCLDRGAEVTSVAWDPTAPPVHRLTASVCADQDAWHLVVPAGHSVAVEWQASADDQVDLLVLDRTFGLKGPRESLLESRRVSGPAVQRHTLTLTAEAHARSFDLVQSCRSGSASWALVVGDASGPVTLLPRPAVGAPGPAQALAAHDQTHAMPWQSVAFRHGHAGLPDHVDGQVVIGETAAGARLPGALADATLQQRERSPAGHRLLDITLHDTATSDDHTLLGVVRPRSEQLRRSRHLLRLLDELERHPGVAYAELVGRARLQQGGTPNDPLWGRQRWAHQRLNLPQAWNYTQGSPSVIVGVVDSGIRTEHDDLAPVLLPGHDFVDDVRNSGDGDGSDPDPYDDGSPNSHGTHVAGIIAARGNDGFGIAGVVMNGSILPVRAIGIDGTGSLLDVAEAIRYAAGLPNRSGLVPDAPCQVLNLSLGSTSDFTPLKQAVTAAMNAGVLVLAAAGNDGRPGLLYPAAYQRVLAVGASTLDDQRAPYSNTGARLDLLAPGGGPGDLDADGQPDQIYSAMGGQAGARPGGFQYLMGTSMACAGASGVAALLWALQPAATATDLAALMTATAKDLGPPGFDNSHGHGRLDALAAMQQVNPILSLNTDSVDLGDNGTAFVVQMSNLGGGELTVNDLVADAVLGPGGWLSATALSDGASIAVTADRTGLAPGPHAVDLQVQTSGGDQTVSFVLYAGAGPLPDVGTVLVEVRTPSGVLRQRMRTTLDKGYGWKLSALPKGAYQLHCGVDLDGDGVLGEAGEPYGVYPDTSRPVPIQLQFRRLVTDLRLE